MLKEDLLTDRGRKALPLPAALLSVALCVFVLLPVGYMNVSGFWGRIFTPAVMAIVLWAIVQFHQRERGLASPSLYYSRFLLFAIFAMLLVSMAFSMYFDTSWKWILTFSICIIATSFVAPLSRQDVWPMLMKVFAFTGIFLGVLAISELLLGWNPWMSVYNSDLLMQTWSVFRAKASLGHPLTLMTYSSVTLVVCLTSLLKARSAPLLFGTVGAAVALILSVSRTGSVAAAVGLAVGLLALFFSGTRNGRRLAVLGAVIGGIAVAVLLTSPLLGERNTTDEGQGSFQYRDDIIPRALTLLENRPLVGTGPGTSGIVFSDATGKIFENSSLQLVVSLGVPTSVLFVLLLAWICLRGVRNGKAAPVAGLAAFFVAITGFNALDANPAILTIPALLIVGALSNPGADQPRPPAGLVRWPAAVSDSLSGSRAFERARHPLGRTPQRP